MPKKATQAPENKIGNENDRDTRESLHAGNNNRESLHAGNNNRESLHAGNNNKTILSNDSSKTHPRFSNDSFSDDDDFLREYTKKRFYKAMEFTEFQEEENLIQLTLSKTIVVHFFKPEFEKCKFMNKALKIISMKFPLIKFGWINVENCPKMCQSLEINTLPFVAMFKGGYLVDCLVGFEKLGGNERFDISALERVLKESNLFSKEVS